MVLGGLLLCVNVFVCMCVRLLFDVCALFVNMLNGVVWSARLYYCASLCAWLLFHMCVIGVRCIV